MSSDLRIRRQSESLIRRNDRESPKDQHQPICENLVSALLPSGSRPNEHASRDNSEDRRTEDEQNLNRHSIGDRRENPKQRNDHVYPANEIIRLAACAPSSPQHENYNCRYGEQKYFCKKSEVFWHGLRHSHLIPKLFRLSLVDAEVGVI